MQVRHGALLVLAALLPALAAVSAAAARLAAEQQAALGRLVARVEAARLLRARGGEVVRAAVCRRANVHWFCTSAWAKAKRSGCCQLPLL